MHHDLSEQDIEHICEAVAKVAHAYSV